MNLRANTFVNQFCREQKQDIFHQNYFTLQKENSILPNGRIVEGFTIGVEVAIFRFKVCFVFVFPEMNFERSSVKKIV